MLSVIALLLLLTFFSVLGLGVAPARMVRQNFVLVPILGYAMLIGLSYVLSANFKISGASAVGYVSLLFIVSLLIRIRPLSRAVVTAMRDGEINQCAVVILIACLSLLLPALLTGFPHFFGDVNFDYFYNSQDSWFLQTHHVLQFTQQQNMSSQIIPLNWSADFQGRFGIALIAAFFAKVLHVNALQFNSLVLNSIVVLFGFSICAFCQEFFGLGRKSAWAAVFFTLLSASFVQAYTYYLLGQLSVMPILVICFIYFKRFLDDMDKSSHLVMIALLLNVLYIMYAILSFFALIVFILSYLVCYRHHLQKNTLRPLIKLLMICLLLFCIVRLLALPEAIAILKGWIQTSHHVVANKSATFVVFSEYLTETFPSLLFGLTNYPSSSSVFAALVSFGAIENSLLLGLGVVAFIVTLEVLRRYAGSNDGTRGARACMVALVAMIMIATSCFFLKSSSYALFKIQTWFMPLLIPLYVYGISANFHMKIGRTLLAVLCVCILAFNLVTSFFYLRDFFVADTNKHFVNIHGIMGNKDIDDLVAKLNSTDTVSVSMFLTNGIEEAWIANSLRNMTFKKVIHNYQPLEEKDLLKNPCSDIQNDNESLSGLLVVANPSSGREDITDSPQGGKVVYTNPSYMVLDPDQLKTLIYFGRGAYPVEYYKSAASTFPSKFRWVEKGAEIIIFSNEDRVVNLHVTVTPGYVVTQSPMRHITITIGAEQYHFPIQATTTVTVPDVKLHKGLSCLVIDSPDQVVRPRRYAGIIRANVSLDPRLTNFAISHVGIQ